MTPPPARSNGFAPAAVLLLAMALAAAAATAVLFLKGALGYDSSDLCGPEDDDLPACSLDVEANQRQQDLVFTMALASGAAAVVLTGGSIATGIAAGAAGRKRG